MKRRLAPVLAVAMMIALAGPMAAQQPTDEALAQPWWERATKPLTPEIEKALAEVAEKITPGRKKDLTDYMQGEVEAVAKLLGQMDEAKKKTLTDAAEKAVAESIKPFPQRVTEINRIRLTAAESSTPLDLIAKWDLEAISTNRLVLGCTSPDEQPVWKDAVKAVLSAEELAIWSKQVAAAKQEEDKVIQESLAGWVKTAKLKAKASMDARITGMAPVMQLSEEKKTKLKAVAEELIDKRCAEEEKRAMESFHFMVPARRKTFLQSNPMFRSYTLEADPEPQEAWKKALAEVTAPEERERWDKHLADRKAKVEKDIPILLKQSLDRMRTTWDTALERDLAALLANLNVPAERTKNLAPVKKAVLERAEKAWTKLATQRFTELTPESREGIIKNGRGYYVNLPTQDAPQSDPEWKKALEGLVTPEEKKQVELTKAQRRTRREGQVAQLAVAVLDRKIYFSEAQRQALLPILAKLATQNSQLFPTEPAESGTSFSSEMIVNLAGKVKEEELKGILDGLQLAAWKKLNAESGRTYNRTGKAADPIPGRRPETEDVEGLIATFLYEKSRWRHANLLSMMVGAAEDAARIAKLEPEKATRLKTAARGATEKIMLDWRRRSEDAVRSQIQGAVYQDVNQRMVAVDDYYFNMYQSQKPEEQDVWKQALKSEMNEEQYKKWQDEQKARSDAHDKGVAAFVMAEFDRKVLLTPEQSEILAPKIQAVVKDYSYDLQNYFSSSDGEPWYMQYYSLMVPMAGVPEKEMKTIILPPQWDRWTKTNEYGNCMTYWTNLNQMHEQRVKAQKK
ncbi:MAG TPA: hypothetical protein VK956_16960 [Verrucomicrobium sp.]|nr:hypothetical protein [Verrucomicrobium sp.]